MEDRERPSRHGAILGDFLSAVEVEGRKHTDAPAEMCSTCAFRSGTMTNQMASTGLDAFRILTRMDGDRFACHHGMTDGQPTKLCAGYLNSINAPFEAVKAEAERLSQRLVATSGPDEVRSSFDAWREKVDPDGLLNDYQLGRKYQSGFSPAEEGK